MGQERKLVTVPFATILGSTRTRTLGPQVPTFRSDYLIPGVRRPAARLAVVDLLENSRIAADVRSSDSGSANRWFESILPSRHWRLLAIANLCLGRSEARERGNERQKISHIENSGYRSDDLNSPDVTVHATSMPGPR